MKLYHELSAIESDIIQLDLIVSTMNMISAAIDNTEPPHQEIKKSFVFITDQLEKLNNSLRYHFDGAWDADRNNPES